MGKCGACGQEGHNKNNHNCPLFGKKNHCGACGGFGHIRTNRSCPMYGLGGGGAIDDAFSLELLNNLHFPTSTRNDSRGSGHQSSSPTSSSGGSSSGPSNGRGRRGGGGGGGWRGPGSSSSNNHHNHNNHNNHHHRPGSSSSSSQPPFGFFPPPTTSGKNGVHFGSKLGQGGFGQVWECTAPAPYPSNVRLAAKVMLPGAHTAFGQPASSLLALFTREVTMMREARGRNVVEVFGAEDTDKGPAIIMKRYDGTLDDLIGTSGGLRRDRRRFTRYLADMLRGLAHLHSRNIVVRDLKPENCLYDSGKDEVVLSDLGLATRLASASAYAHTGAAGTVAYMDREAFIHQSYSANSDMWCLAQTAYEMFIGVRLTASDNPARGKLPSDMPFLRWFEECYNTGQSRRPSAAEFLAAVEAGRESPPSSSSRGPASRAGAGTGGHPDASGDHGLVSRSSNHVSIREDDRQRPPSSRGDTSSHSRAGPAGYADQQRTAAAADPPPSGPRTDTRSANLRPSPPRVLPPEPQVETRPPKSIWQSAHDGDVAALRKELVFVNPNSRGDGEWRGRTPLLIACNKLGHGKGTEGHFEVVKELIARKADVSMPSQSGITPLRMLAACEPTSVGGRVAKLLVDAGAC